MNYSIMKKTGLLISAVLLGCTASADDAAELKEYGCTAVDIYNYAVPVPETDPAEDWCIM